MNDTKEQIIHETFRLLSKSGFSVISLSEIAARVGVSKAAIFRHFPNKEALFLELRSRFFDALAVPLHDIDFRLLYADSCSIELKKDLYFRLVKFFSATPEYLLYFLMSLSSGPDFEYQTVAALQERGVPMPDIPAHGCRASGKNLDRYVHFLYALSTSVYFINEKKRLAPDLDPDVFTRALCSLVFFGWKTLEDIPPERAAELDQLALVSGEELPQVDRIFGALAAVIERHGVSGVTIERVASELGLVKSSLYTYFSNKNEMLMGFIAEEIRHFVRLQRTRVEALSSVSESVYVQLQTVLSYLLQRKSVVPVFDWLRHNGTFMPGDLREVYEGNSYTYTNREQRPEIGFELTDYSLAGWVATLPIPLFVQGKFHQFSDEQLFEAVRKIYVYMKNGINYMKKEFGN